MSRRGGTPKRTVTPDPIYKSTVVTKLINQIMLDGKRGTAQRICYDAFDIIGEKTGKDPMEVFEAAMENIMPALEVKARRVGGATYQVPMEVRPERRQTLALRWMTAFSRARGERTMCERVAAEIMDAANNTGASVRRKERQKRTRHSRISASNRSAKYQFNRLIQFTRAIFARVKCIRAKRHPLSMT